MPCISVVPHLLPSLAETAPSVDIGEEVRFNLFQERQGVVFSFVFTFWLEQRGGGAPALSAEGLSPGARPKVFVVFC